LGARRFASVSVLGFGLGQEGYDLRAVERVERVERVRLAGVVLALVL
jgi:hypothetical protein